MPLRLNIVIASTRPGRVGPSVAHWMDNYARQEGSFDVHLVDLAEVALPLYDEPRHPRLQQYEHAHTRAWSESVAAADAFVFVTPEYNYGPSPALLNALNYVYNEWNYNDVPPGIRTVLSWNFPLMIPGSGRGEFHEEVEVHRGADRVCPEAG